MKHCVLLLLLFLGAFLSISCVQRSRPMEFYEQSFEGLGEAVAGHMAKHGQWPASILDLEDPRSRKWAQTWHIEPPFDDELVTLMAGGGLLNGELVWRNFSTQEFVEPNPNKRRAVPAIISRVWSYYSQEGRFPSAEDSHIIFEGLADGWSLVRRKSIFSSTMQVIVYLENVEGHPQRMIVISDSGFARMDD